MINCTECGEESKDYMEFKQGEICYDCLNIDDDRNVVLYGRNENGVFQDYWNKHIKSFNEYWVKELTNKTLEDNNTYLGEYNSWRFSPNQEKKIDLPKKLSYTNPNIVNPLIDYYGFVDSGYINNLVPSMNKQFGDNEEDWFWVSFPNSNKLNEENEEWNNFGVMICYNTSPIEIDNSCSIFFDTIEEVLGFIESNPNPHKVFEKQIGKNSCCIESNMQYSEMKIAFEEEEWYCDKCDTLYSIPIELERFWEDIEEVK